MYKDYIFKSYSEFSREVDSWLDRKYHIFFYYLCRFFIDPRLFMNIDTYSVSSGMGEEFSVSVLFDGFSCHRIYFFSFYSWLCKNTCFFMCFCDTGIYFLKFFVIFSFISYPDSSSEV